MPTLTLTQINQANLLKNDLQQIVQETIDELKAKIGKNLFYEKNRNVRREERITELTALQASLNNAVSDFTQSSTLSGSFFSYLKSKFDNFVQKYLHHKDSESISTFLKKAEQCFSKHNLTEDNDWVFVKDTLYSEVKVQGATSISTPQQHSDDSSLHYSDIDHSGNTQQQKEGDYANLPAPQGASGHSGQEEEIFGTVGGFQSQSQGASGHSDQAGSYETSSQQQSSTPKALPKGHVDPNATYATVDLTKKHTDRAQDLQSSTLFMRQQAQNQQSADQSSNYEFKK
ncbi:hypothetical protein Psal006b_02139 [Piscirickettsia salmonis]|uniref:Uncharacterized protein n=1 Tax=Piscirickettsia salmonis TaxID=1238 RepID=A0A1L6TAI6_PISSA|nr:hypothetical protein [Piscirickettsia salmonis]AKP73493.1 hypothetical protein PSLF89_1637 [Piscirickettsia salmonis LF-89 = ATCC VR-1361]ALB22253.1 hypothetical protein KU39_1070 [Piscirickettsia salmonis]ALY02355.1 hypothetical protein AWE47_05370 [Piscirickettsia salmonis]AMA41872.1 hypothetical protein AWJ11_05370 [Piscirickettsia salmonis]AOS34348.1 hypothetical protein AVM72_02590 [Piscirickettsia salmonis]